MVMRTLNAVPKVLNGGSTLGIQADLLEESQDSQGRIEIRKELAVEQGTYGIVEE